MGAVLIDNWSLEESIEYIQKSIENKEYEFYHQENSSTKTWCNFLSTIVLWDELWFCEGYTSLFWMHSLAKISNNANSNRMRHTLCNLKNKLYNVDADTTNNILEAISADQDRDKYLIHYPHLYYSPDYLSRRKYIMPASELSDPYRADLYFMFGNTLGINTLLHPKRDMQIKKNRNNFFSRSDLLNEVDKEVLDYYDFINEKIGRELLTFNFPVLYDYIRKNSDNVIDELEAAIILSMSDDVCYFRDSIDDIEIQIKNGNTQAILSAIHTVSNTTKSIIEKYKEERFIGEISLSVSPSFSFPLKTKKTKSNLHTAFIKDIVEYAVYKRKSN